MLADVLGNYLETLTEREFDSPFMGILRDQGFYDIHFLHGQFEFGKDFIAKKAKDAPEQFVFQSKAGNLGLTEWRGIKPQVDELITDDLAHPNFDKYLPRVGVLVTTGRLVGGAALSAQEYGRHVQQKKEGLFEVWDRETLINMLTASPELGLEGSLNTDLLAIVGEISGGRLSPSSLEQFSRLWLSEDIPLFESGIHASIIGNRLRKLNRLDLAALTSLCWLRSLLWRSHDNRTDASEALIDSAGRLFEEYVTQIWEQIGSTNGDSLLEGTNEFATFATYPVRCLRVAELISLLAIRFRRELNPSVEAVETFLVELARSQPGAAHPISDNWAASLLPFGLVLGRCDPEAFDTWAMKVGAWVADYYERYEGLAGLDSDPATEINYLLGGPLEHVSLNSRSTSLVASALLDLASIYERSQVFNSLRNEFMAVDIICEILEVPDNRDQYLRDGASVTRELNVPYDEYWNPTTGWISAPHHRRNPESYLLARSDRAWEQLAIISVLRDRWFVSTLRSMTDPS